MIKIGFKRLGMGMCLRQDEAIVFPLADRDGIKNMNDTLLPPTASGEIESLLGELNDEQFEAVTCLEGPSLVLAGAGSGKTRVLTYKIAAAIAEGAHPMQILAVTFTNKAAREMKERVSRLIGEPGGSLWMGTFHSICGRILRREIEQYTSKSGRSWTNRFVIYDESETNAAMKDVVKSLNLDEKLYNAKSLKHQISGFKNQLLDAYDYASTARGHSGERLAQIYDAYEAALSRNNALDFDDMLLMCVKLLQQNPAILERYHRQFAHILVDEFQDTNETQYALVRLLAEGFNRQDGIPAPEMDWTNRSLTVVGDVDQSIYSWRGANFRILMNFQSDFPTARLVKLQKNYRSTANILSVANAIIEQNTERLPKELISVRGDGERIFCYEAEDDRDEAHFVIDRLVQWQRERRMNAGDCCILYRTNVQSRVLEDVLIARGIPYQMVGGLKFYERKEIKDVLAYLTVIFNEDDGYSVKRVLNVPKRGIGKTSLELLERTADLNRMSLYQVLKQAEQINGLKPKAVKAIGSFVALVERLKVLAQTVTLDEVVLSIMDFSGYLLELQSEDPEDNDGRVANVQEFVSVIRQFLQEDTPPEDEPPEERFWSQLARFLTSMALLSDIDTSEPAENRIVLMTLHAAKGLEFPLVALCGLEEGMFPHFRSLEDKSQMEEERRLMYVGVTRAMEQLLITYSRRRLIMGELRYGQPSRFLDEIPPQLLTGSYGFDRRGSRRFSSSLGAGPPGRRGQFDEPFSDSDEPVSSFQTRTPQGTSRGQARESGYSRFNGNPSSFGGRTNASRPASFPAKGETSSPLVGKSAAAPEHSAPLNLLKVGDRVSHAKFGEGTVSQVLGEGDKAIYSIQFDAIAGKKLLDPKFAKLDLL